jgi:hypothetical protein
LRKNNNDSVDVKPAAARKRGHQKDVEVDSTVKTVDAEENNQSEEADAAKKPIENTSSKSISNGASEKGLLCRLA